jgi:hypothetical protein
MERDMEIHRLTARLRSLRRFGLVADPGVVEGSRVRSGRPRRPRGVRRGCRGRGRPLCRDDAGYPTTRHPDDVVTS